MLQDTLIIFIAYYSTGIFPSVLETAIILKGFFWFGDYLLINELFERCSIKSGKKLSVEP